jgi:hypothetical protein
MVQINLSDVPVNDPGVQQQLASGMQTTSTIRQKLIAERLLYQNSTLLAIGTQLLETQWTDDLEFRFTIPGEMTYTYDVPESVGPGEIEHVEHTPIGGRIKKGFISWGQTIEAAIRGNVKAQNAITQRQAELAVATSIDNHILTQINTAAGATAVAVDADAKWDGLGIHSPNIVGDVAQAFNNIFSESNVSAREIKNLALVIPAALYGSVITVSQINNIVQSLEKYFKTSFGLTVYPTRDSLFATQALLMVKGAQTGFFGRLKPEAIRAAGHQSTWLEQKPIVGWVYTSCQFWGAYTIPYPNTGTTTTRICKLTGVL